MYDSRSDHPRGWRTRAGKSKHGSSHPRRAEARYYGPDFHWGRAVPDLTMPQRVDLADRAYDGTDAYEDVPGLKRLGAIEWDQRFDDWFDDSDNWHDEPERLADWERDLLDLPEHTVWQTQSGHDMAWAEIVTHGYESEDEYVEEFLEESADAPDTHWLAGDPRDFFQSVGDAWVIEGPSVTKPEPLRAGHYVRVYELAREVGIESKDLIRHLRLSGEYVKAHTSYVALPVADRVKAIADVLVDTYGARKAERPDPIARMRVLLAEEARHARAKTQRPVLRPGAPRPGNNPFSPAYARSM